MTVVNDPHGQLLSHVLKWCVGWTVCRSLLHYSANTINVDSMLAHCWGIVANGLPTLTHHRINVSYFRDTVSQCFLLQTQTTRLVHPVLVQCWASVADGEPTLEQRESVFTGIHRCQLLSPDVWWPYACCRHTRIQYILKYPYSLNIMIQRNTLS